MRVLTLRVLTLWVASVSSSLACAFQSPPVVVGVGRSAARVYTPRQGGGPGAVHTAPTRWKPHHTRHSIRGGRQESNVLLCRRHRQRRGSVMTMMTSVATAVAVNGALAAAGVAAKQKALTPAGLAHGWLLGVILLSSFVGWRGYATCVLYLVCGSLVTKVRQKQKEAEGIAEKRGGARGPENVWGAALTAALCALAGTLIFKASAARDVLSVAYTASLATKLSDTTASEIGKAFGKTTYLITTLRPVPRGTEGAVSLEGTFAGVVGSLVLACFAALVGLVPWLPAVPICLAAAYVATTVESYLGATLQDSVPFLTNEVVNFINTLVGAAVAGLLFNYGCPLPVGALILVAPLLIAAPLRYFEDKK